MSRQRHVFTKQIVAAPRVIQNSIERWVWPFHSISSHNLAQLRVTITGSSQALKEILLSGKGLDFINLHMKTKVQIVFVVTCHDSSNHQAFCNASFGDADLKEPSWSYNFIHTQTRVPIQRQKSKGCIGIHARRTQRQLLMRNRYTQVLTGRFN